MHRLRQVLRALGSFRIPFWLRNKYSLVTLGFLVWMLFFDPNNLFEQAERMRTLNRAEQKKTWYEAEIKTIQADLDELLSDEQAKEKFAREHYLMKRPDEDVFVILDR